LLTFYTQPTLQKIVTMCWSWSRIDPVWAGRKHRFGVLGAMKNSSNIVHLNLGRGAEAQPHLPLPLIRLRDTSTEKLKALLGRMFDSADDALFELADRAGSNSEQSLYFDGMREVRLKRKQSEMTFL